MKHIYFFCLFFMIMTTQTAESQTIKTFKLDNGFTVILVEDHSEPKVFGAVATKVGSKNDPEDKTGMAHYFEHIMFKGTDKIGTLDYEKEKPYLDKIAALYDELALFPDDETKRSAILKQINELSIEASNYAIAGETDKLLNKYGGANINAYTHYDHTVYHNTFSPNYLDKWLTVYAERFRNPVFRMFQAELETIYEERNMYADMMGSKAIEDIFKKAIKKHPYRNPIIGTVQHLKTPSINKMMEFYRQYYVAGNMALILVGDFETEKIIPQIEKTFGQHIAGEAPKFPAEKYTEPPFNGREFYSGRYIPLKAGVICYKGVAVADPDKIALDYCMKILSNESQTGLLDRLRVENKVMMSMGIQLSLNDMGALAVVFAPKLLCSLKKTEARVTAVINDLKSGNFSDELFDALKTSFVKHNAMLIENKVDFGNLLVELFSSGQTWDDYLVKINKYQTITRQEIIDAANKYFTDNRFVFYNKTGFSSKAEKIKKPGYAPLPSVNRNAQSEFAKEIAETKDIPCTPRFLDFKSDFRHEDLKKNLHLVTGENPLNDIFTIKFSFGFGKNANKFTELVPEHLQELGTDTKTVGEFRSAMQKLGSSYELEAHKTSLILTVDGFDKNFEETMILVNDFLSNIKPDEKQMSKLLHDIKERNKMERKNLNILARAHYDYVTMGSKSEYLNRASVSEVKKMKSSDITNLFKDIIKHETTIVYVGKISFGRVKEIIASKISFPENLKDADKSFFDIKEYDSDLTSVFNYKKANQVISYFYASGKPATGDNDRVTATFFNNYFGEGMLSVMFQEVRELRSLSYSANAKYFFPGKLYAGFRGFLSGNIATQADKTFEALELIDSLVKNFPQKPELVEDIKNSFKESINNTLPSFRDIPRYGFSLIEQGYGEDFRKLLYRNVDSLDMELLNKFHEQFIRSKPLIHIISGNKKKMEINERNKQEVKLKNILTE